MFSTVLAPIEAFLLAAKGELLQRIARELPLQNFMASSTIINLAPSCMHP